MRPARIAGLVAAAWLIAAGATAWALDSGGASIAGKEIVRHASSGAAPAAVEAETLSITTGTGSHVFSIEVADDDASRSRGLMFRQSMAPDAGMLFDFGETRPISMWMMNTYLPLDMVFIREDGTVARIAERTTPFSTETVASGEPVLAVLEVNGGTAERIGLKAGDRVEHPIFAR